MLLHDTMKENHPMNAFRESAENWLYGGNEPSPEALAYAYATGQRDWHVDLCQARDEEQDEGIPGLASAVESLYREEILPIINEKPWEMLYIKWAIGQPCESKERWE